MSHNAVVIERLPEHNYFESCVTLPRDYGAQAWNNRKEVQAIQHAVFTAMDTLANETDIMQKLANRPVVVKPNLVLVYNDIGTKEKYYPETTDPRVLDALIVWLKEKAHSASVIIAESSGRGAPTRANFTLAGVDRIARYRNCSLIALEEQPAVRYVLPHAEVQKEILIPELFDHVVKGEYAYISVPKLKTNLYTGVTLGFKNAMGVIPYNLRQRAHNHNIDRKLVEMLYLFKPDVVLIDGVVGGEGECPGPVYPVDSRMIVAGNHAVETDRVATKLMGFEPQSIKLITIADELGFGSSNVKIIGDSTPVHFREADASLISERVQKIAPGITVLYGLGNHFSQDVLETIDREIKQHGVIEPQYVRAMERFCRGGCVASTRLGFAMLEAEGYQIERAGVIILGGGILLSGVRWWFDKNGKAYTLESIQKLPGKKAVIGSCSKPACKAGNWYVDGCMPLANAPHAILHKVSRTHCKILSVQNKRLWLLVKSIVEQRHARVSVLKQGKRLDVDFPFTEKPDAIPEALGSKNESFVAWPLPPIDTKKEQKKLIANEDAMALASVIGIIVPCLMEKISWFLKGVFTGIVTWGFLAASIVYAANNTAQLLSRISLVVFFILESLHIAELPIAISMYNRSVERGEIKKSMKRLLVPILGTLICGFPAWMPYKLGIERDIDII
ncbi:MAG TPA: DUF362 domain-containing protein [Spirochaetales bacterium]|nr:DUF362 domain-containing protein [Spirochaetales bacterium]